MADKSDTQTGFGDTQRLERLHGWGWVFLLWVTVLVSADVTDRPEIFDGPLDTAVFTGATVLLLGGGSLVFLPVVHRYGSWVRLTAAAVALAAWTMLIAVDDEWSLASFGVYAMCYSLGSRLGLATAAYVSIVWAATIVLSDIPLWFTVMPLGVFVVSSILSITIYRISELNARQTDLITELRAAQRDLVDAERGKGVLEERARMAAEIHDTLAQGFTSIVLLGRAGIRSGDATEALKTIEETAQENLADARRLIEAIRPPELGAGSLPMALERQLESALPEQVSREFAVEGEPRALNGAVEVTVLRAAQEALLNIRNHARADRVDVVLRFDDESVTLDVRDNGVGFTPGEVADRGDLTGGQGLALLRRRAESLSGRLDLDTSNNGQGSVLSLTLPVVGR